MQWNRVKLPLVVTGLLCLRAEALDGTVCDLAAGEGLVIPLKRSPRIPKPSSRTGLIMTKEYLSDPTGISF